MRRFSLGNFDLLGCNFSFDPKGNSETGTKADYRQNYIECTHILLPQRPAIKALAIGNRFHQCVLVM
jgi:hypothetical protein